MLSPPGSRVAVLDAVAPVCGLTPWLREATRALAATLFATDEGAPPAERLDWLCDDLDDFLGRAGPRARGMFRLCVTVVAVVAPWHIGRAASLHRLPDDTRAQALERMERGPFGLAVFGAKAVLCILWYEHPEVARAVGYDGRCLR